MRLNARAPLSIGALKPDQITRPQIALPVDSLANISTEEATGQARAGSHFVPCLPSGADRYTRFAEQDADGIGAALSLTSEKAQVAIGGIHQPADRAVAADR